MKPYRCPECGCGFVIVSVPGEKKSKGASCPLCKAKAAALDPVEAIGAKIAREAWKLWQSLPSSDDD